MLFQWGEESGLYFYGAQRPPTLIGATPLFGGPLAEVVPDGSTDTFKRRVLGGDAL